MTPATQQSKPRHEWVSNTAFRQLTGIKKVCLLCGQRSNNADPVCPGKRKQP